MFIYQRDNSNRNGHIQTNIYDDFSFPMHLHGDMEMAFALSGEVRLHLREREETLKEGMIALILPHELHAYSTQAHSRILVCVFSVDHVHTFAQSIEGMRGDRTVVPCSPELEAYLMATFFDAESPGLLQYKAAFYAICAQYQRYAQFSPVRTMENGALEKLILYVEENYRENITLSSAARMIGYNESYLSRCFHQATGVNFRQFVNYHRIQCVLHELCPDGRGISELALSSGFQNLRSFNRAFSAFMGMSPREYLAAHETMQHF